MTSTNSIHPNARPPLQTRSPQLAEPPRSQPSSQPIAHLQPEPSQSPAAATASTPSVRVPKRLLILGAIALAVGAIGMIPMTDTVTGEATIQSTPGQRQVVTMGRSARVSAIYVRQNDRVRVGQLLAELSSDELQQQLMEVERQLAEARAERETARQALNVALEKGTGAQIKTQNQMLRATQLRDELGQLAAGQAPPRIRQLQSQQAEKQRQIQGITAQLAIVNDQLNRYQGLVREGALPLAKVDELRREAISLQTQQAALQAQVETLNQQIATAQKEMQDDWVQRRQPEVIEAQALVAISQQETAAAAANVKQWERQIPLLEAKRQHLQRQQEGLKLRARVAGVVTTPDLDVLEGQKLPEGKELMTIATVVQPTVILELPQSEAQRLKVGMPVTVRLQDEGLTGYPARVQEIPPITAPENPQQPQQKAIVKVRVQLQEQPVLTLGAKGYAHVQIGHVWLYQKVQRELLKLFPVGRFF